MLAQASFGTFGANVPSLVRGPSLLASGTAHGDFGRLGWPMVTLLIRNESFLTFHQSSHMLGHSTLEVTCYVIVWVLQPLIIQRGMETVRKFQNWAGPAVWIMMLILSIYLLAKGVAQK